MNPLVTLEQVDLALKLDLVEDDERTPDIEWKMRQATEIVIDYLKRPDHEWTVEDVPGQVSAAIILAIRALLDGEEAELLSGLANSDTSSPVVALLMRLRDPAVA
ncbi:phage gp6-like head-tail connector protein [Chelativorans sp. Marseille-P2723]|uniref:phage gp6-like head-tail connector protein n=1 Tax=Chelativorans sp. Marseille-P2723 TaxID=2709133 RepID=UPI00156D7B29|nr:phage gp6-like head-tail connector protein [Chelativorans sp. Marseille-P2723]